MTIRVLKKFSGGGVILLDFSHVGVRGVWLNVQLDLRLGKKYCSGVSKIADFRHLWAMSFPSPFADIASEAHLDNQGHVSRSVQTAMIFLFGRERRKDRQ